MLSASPAPAAARGPTEVAARTSDVATAHGSDVSAAPAGSDVSAAPAGTYCDVISGAAVDGACTGTVVAVNAAGQATVTVPAMGAVGIDVNTMATVAMETVTVSVPGGTPSGETVYLAGNLSVLGEGAADWNPAGIAMTPLSPTQWTAVVTATASTSLSYKYDVGGSWDNVEETADCGYVANRTMSVDGGSVDDTVAAWAGLGSC